jgi:hypothetical protein
VKFLFAFCITSIVLLSGASQSFAFSLTELFVKAGSLQSGFAKDVEGEGKAGLETWKVRSLRLSDEFYAVMEDAHRAIERLPEGTTRNEWMARFNKFLIDAIPSHSTYSRLFKRYELRLIRFPGRAVSLLFADGPSGEKVVKEFCRNYVDTYVEREPHDGVEMALFRVHDVLNARALFIPIEVNRMVTDGDFKASEPRFGYYKALAAVGEVKNIYQLELLQYLRANVSWDGSLMDNLPSLGSVVRPVENQIPLMGLQAYMNSPVNRGLSLKDFIELKTREDLEAFLKRFQLAVDVCGIDFGGYY